MSIVAPTSVYLYYDVSDILIYVGITSRGVRRQAEHNSDKEWWPFVARQEVEHHETREAASARERDLIQRFAPPFNRQHNASYRQARDAYLRFAVSRSDADSWRDQARESKMRLPLEPHEFGNYERVVLRTRLEDASIVAAIRPSDKAPKVLGLRTIGTIVRLEKVGPLALFHLSTTRRHPILDADVFLRMDAKQTCLTIRHLQARLDHSDPVRCGPKCPKVRRPMGGAA